MDAQGEIKTFHVTGEAAKSVGGFEKKRQRRTTRKKQEGGESEQVISIPSMNVQKAPMVPPTPEMAKPVTIQLNRSPVPIVPATPQPPIAQQEGGVKNIKVELRKKTATKKVQLHPKKADAPKVQKKIQTRKARKVLLGVSSLHKRMTRAKKLHKKTKEMPLDKLKEELIKKKLIKSTSKAPETVLRQIAVDAQIVATKSL